VVVIDTELTPELRAEGDARELQRAVQELRREAGLELDDRIELWLGGVAGPLEVYLADLADEVLADRVAHGQPAGDGFASTSVELGSGSVDVALRALRA
jgi:isoleucyl-tRNA synthetase